MYSLGAILYELLTLQPPIDKEGGYLAILLRVMQGEMVPPEQRTPHRARAGKIPRELSAITMKALAKEPRQRYPHVEALRKDIERFQEGRTVSAKEYTTKELVWKLVKRNKVASVLTFLLAGVLVWSFAIWFQAQRETAQAQQQTAQAQQDLHDHVKKSVPVFVDAARLYVDGKKLSKALEQLDVALIADQASHEALLLKAQILMVRKEFAAAQRELDKYLKQRPNDADARQLAEFCEKGDPKDATLFHAIANVFQRQQVPSLAEQATLGAGDSLAARQQLLPVYQKKIETAWTGLGTKLSLDKDGKLHLDLTGCTQVTALQPLNGLPLTSLNLSQCERIQDLTPIRGMPLSNLSLYGCGQLSDLTPLKGLPLTTLSLRSCGRVTDRWQAHPRTASFSQLGTSR